MKERPDRGRPERLRVARLVQYASALVALSLVAFWTFGLWSRMADARSDGRDDAEVAADDSTQQLADGGPPTLATDFDPGAVYLTGDSLTSTAYNVQGLGKDAPDDVIMAAWPGWTAAEAQSGLEDAVADGQVDTLVVALGTNDSSYTFGADGWSQADADRFRRLLATPPPTACVVMVLPGVGEGVQPDHAEALTTARTDLAALAEQRRATPGTGPTVVLDWQAEVTTHPELLASDGIHLANDPDFGLSWPSAESAGARFDFYWQGVARCAD
jgi:hypothetical protein